MKPRHAAFLLPVVLVSCRDPIVKAPAAPEAAKLVFDTDPSAVRVQMIRQPAAPLTVDWSLQDRKQLEARVHQKGAILVRFDEQRLAPLPDCRPSGSYVFTGVTHGRERIAARTTAELAANFPLTAVTLGGRYTDAEQMSADLHVVGMANLDRPSLGRADLTDPRCKGATHVVTEVTHGGFRFGAARELDVAAQAGGAGFGASASSNGASGRLSEDGVVTACEHASWKDVEPPAQCGGVIRIRLVPLEEAQAEAPKCPQGLRWTGSGCASERLAQASAPSGRGASLDLTRLGSASGAGYRCDPTNVRECASQCSAGNADSCSSLGLAYASGRGVSRDLASAMKLFNHACANGSSEGCLDMGSVLLDQKRGPEALAYSSKACAAGNAGGCTNQGYILFRGLYGVPQNVPLAFDLFARACARREFAACNNAGVMAFFDDTGTVKTEPRVACSLFAKSCDAGEATSCANLGICAEHGIARPRSVDAAFKMYIAACDAGSPFGCVWGARLLEESAPTDPRRTSQALAIYEKACGLPGVGGCVSSEQIRRALPGRYQAEQVDGRACDGGNTQGLACYNAARLLGRGIGVAANPGRAAALMSRACTEFDLQKACRR